jgi:isocitrate dehydrogenase
MKKTIASKVLTYDFARLMDGATEGNALGLAIS